MTTFYALQLTVLVEPLNGPTFWLTPTAATWMCTHNLVSEWKSLYYVDSCYMLYITYRPILYVIVGDLQWHASPVVHGYGLRPEKKFVISSYILYS